MFKLFPILGTLLLLLSDATSSPLGRQECQKQPGKKWNTEEGRCKNTPQTVETREGHKKCAGIEDEKKRGKCLQTLAETAVKKEIGDLKRGNFTQWERYFSIPPAALNATLSVIALAGKGFDGPGTCLSRKIFMGASLAHVLSEAYILALAGGTLKKLEEEYKGPTGQPYNAQVRAFEYLEKEQLALAEFAAERRNAYIAVAAAYGASAGVAAYELISKPEGCGGSAAGETQQTEIGSGGPAKNAVDLLGHPTGVLILSLVSGGISGVLAFHAHSEHEKAKENAKLVKKIKESFEKTASYTCLDGRKNRENPQCYCYLPSRKKNPLRTKSETCQALWAKNDRSLYRPATDYSLPRTKVSRPCATKEGQTDPQCRCRQRSSSKSKACLSLSSRDLSLPGFDTSAFTQTTPFEDINRMLSGLAPANISNGAGPGKKAVRAHKRGVEALKNLNENRKKEGLKPIVLGPRLQGKLLQSLSSPSTLRKAHTSSLENLASRIRPTKGKGGAFLKKALAQKELKGVLYQGGKPKKGKGKKKDPFAFLHNEEAAHAPKVQNFTDAPYEGYDEYDYKDLDADLVKRQGVSLWQVISHRYNVTGYKRLFE